MRNTERAEAWSKAADDDAIVTPVVTEDEAGDDNIASAANECARTEIRQSRAGGRIQIVDFDEANACPSVVRVAAHNCRVSGRRQPGVNRRFEVACRRQSAVLNLGLLRISPVVIRYRTEPART